MEERASYNVHTHKNSDGTIYTHSHVAETNEHEVMHGHYHVHSHTQTKAVLNRMARLIGHLESIKTMVQNGRDCSEVLVQLSAVKSAIIGVSKIF